jgi:enoyl-CoA hydratase/carnithine racemase
VFCAGADLKSIATYDKIASDKGGFAGFVAYPRTKPMIAAVDGFAIAGGCEIVLACDLVVASEYVAVQLVRRSAPPTRSGGAGAAPRRPC